MTIHLTPEQQQVLDSESSALARVVDPRTNSTYVLVPETDYDVFREVVDEEHRRQGIHAVALRNAAGRLDEAP